VQPGPEDRAILQNHDIVQVGNEFLCSCGACGHTHGSKGPANLPFSKPHECSVHHQSPMFVKVYLIYRLIRSRSLNQYFLFIFKVFHFRHICQRFFILGTFVKCFSF
jgi:hypothetical protein